MNKCICILIYVILFTSMVVGQNTNSIDSGLLKPRIYPFEEAIIEYNARINNDKFRYVRKIYDSGRLELNILFKYDRVQKKRICIIDSSANSNKYINDYSGFFKLIDSMNRQILVDSSSFIYSRRVRKRKVFKTNVTFTDGMIQKQSDSVFFMIKSVCFFDIPLYFNGVYTKSEAINNNVKYTTNEELILYKFIIRGDKDSVYRRKRGRLY